MDRALGPKAKGRSAAPVARDEEGEVVQSEDHLLAMWERPFAQEFMGRAVIMDRAEYDERLAADCFQLPQVAEDQLIHPIEWMD
eukprot:3299593-Lingulodinium_polyedra.AAC.1